MLIALKSESNYTFTENGARTYRTSGSDCLDLFATVGALRSQDEEEIIARFMRAYAENPLLAMKTLFYARDIRGGLGERRVFRTTLRWLAGQHGESVRRNVALIAEYGRFDDLLTLLDTPCRKAAMDVIGAQLEADKAALAKGDSVSLLGKWLPSANASSAETVRLARSIAHGLGMSQAEYRRTLSALRAKIGLVENNLREKDYTFEYSAVPSKAMLKYARAFYRNDGARYGAYLEDVAEGRKTIHTGTLMPYEIVEKVIKEHAGIYTRHPQATADASDAQRRSLDVMWNNLEDFTNDENALVVVDGSGSMYSSWWKPMPASVALSLGIYFAERSKGAFHNHFITFSRNPRLVEVKGADIVDKVRYCESFNECANTDIAAVFKLILKAALKNNVPQAEMPARLYIVSDMEFDACAENASKTNFEAARDLFAHYGYKLPEVVFWNVASRNTQQPVTKNEQGAALVSGCTPRIFALATTPSLTPYQLMLDILGSERYARVAA